MTISTNIHNHTISLQINQENFENKFLTPNFKASCTKLFSLSEKRTKRAKGIISYLFSPKLVINATAFQENSVDDSAFLQFKKALSLVPLTNCKRLTGYYSNKSIFFKLILFITKTFLCLPPFLIGVK